MPKEETIELRQIRGVIGEKEEIPQLNQRSSLLSKVKAISLKISGASNLLHDYGLNTTKNTLTLNAGENGGICGITDGTYAYIGCEGVPILVKIDLKTFTRVSSITLTMNSNIRDIKSDGTYLYVATHSSPAELIKVQISNFTQVDSLTFPADYNNCKGILINGSYIYCATYSTIANVGSVVSVNIDTFTIKDTINIVGTGASSCICTDGNYIYVGHYGTPSKVSSIFFDTFTLNVTRTLPSGFNDARQVLIDGIYLYVVCGTTPGKVAKYDLDTFNLIYTLTFDAGTLINTYSSIIDGTYLHVGAFDSPGQVARIDLATFKPKSIQVLDTGENGIRGIFYDGLYLYYILSTSPTKIVQQYIYPNVTSSEKKTDLTDISVRSVISTSTSNGLSTTLIDTSRTEGDDYWNGLTLLILGGVCKGQSRKITDFDAASDTITVSPAFTAVIASGVRYAILPTGSSSLLITDILTDSTSFNGADIPIIKADTQTIEDSTLKAAPTAGSLTTYIASGGVALGTALPNSKSLYDVIVLDRLDNGTYGLSAIETLVDDLETRLTAIRAGYLDNLTGTVTNGTYSHANNTNEQDVLEFAVTKQKINLYLDMVNIAQLTTVREYIKVDGLTYRQLTQKVYTTDFNINTKAISISIEQPNCLYKVTFQSETAEGSAKDVPYTHITLPRT